MIYKNFGDKLTYNYKVKNGTPNIVQFFAWASLGLRTDGTYKQESDSVIGGPYTLQSGEVVNIELMQSVFVETGKIYSAKAFVSSDVYGEKVLAEKTLWDEVYLGLGFPF